MKPQHINLWDEGFRPRPAKVSFRLALLIPLVLMLAMLLLAWSLHSETDRTLERGRLAVASTTAAATTPSRADQSAQAQLQTLAELQGLMARVHAYEQQMSSMPPSETALAVLQALSDAHMPDVWITGMHWDGISDQIDIEGRLLEPARLPAYLNRLKEQEAFKGKTFSQANTTLVDTPSPSAGPKPADGPARFYLLGNEMHRDARWRTR